MAEVTVNSRHFSVMGDRREQFYNISGSTTNTLTIGLRSVNQVCLEPSTITAYSVAANTSAPGSVITFTASGDFSNVDCRVTGT